MKNNFILVLHNFQLVFFGCLKGSRLIVSRLLVALKHFIDSFDKKKIKFRIYLIFVGIFKNNDDYGREDTSGFYNYSGTPSDLASIPATISDLLTVNIYGTGNTRDEDRLDTVKTKILGPLPGWNQVPSMMTVAV